MNPLIIDVILQEKKQEAADIARHYRLLHRYNQANPPLTARYVLATGILLVRLGIRLQATANRHMGIENGLCREKS
jgi:hypothetical protein